MSTDTIALAEQIARAWNEHGIRYGVTHGLERYPIELGRDLDVIVAPQQMNAATRIVLRILRAENWQPCLYQKPWANWIVAYRDHGEDGALEIDLFPRLQWAVSTLAEVTTGRQNIAWKGPFRVDLWAGFVKRVLIQILGGNLERFAQRPLELALTQPEHEVVQQQLPRFVGEKLAAELCESIAAGDLDALRELVPPLRRAVLLRALRHRPGQAATALWSWLRNESAANLAPQPVAPVVALVGPDGVGKSTVIQVLQAELRQQLLYPKIHVRHWRPGLLPPLASLFKRAGDDCQSNGPQPPRQQAGRLSWLRLLYYAVDFAAGSRLLDQRLAAKMQVVLYDRHALDMYVDPLRYGMRRMPLWMMHIMPQPDLLIALADDPGRIKQRKDEISTDEMQRQLDMWRALHRQGWVDEIIEVAGTPERTADLVLHCIKSFILHRHLEKESRERLTETGDVRFAAGT